MNPMTIQERLADFKVRIDRELSEYFDQAIEETGKHDALTADGLAYAKKFALAGGKRLRAALFYHGYIAGGGTEREDALKASMSVELVHLFLLVHDDIMDRDSLRHGVPTVHEYYQEIGRRMFPGKDTEHFGRSMALILGDMLGAFGNQVLFTSPFPSDRVVRALRRLQETISFTVIGQSQDFRIEYAQDASEAEILRMYENKTARYTIQGPLELGYILSGGDDVAVRQALEEYALPLGVAFQIQDDILGIFGSTEKTGKPPVSDLVEGKMTLLVAHALEAGTGKERERLRVLLKRATNITEREIEEFRALLRRTGSLEYSKDTAREAIGRGLRAIEQCPGLEPEARSFLVDIAGYMSSREY